MVLIEHTEVGDGETHLDFLESLPYIYWAQNLNIPHKSQIDSCIPWDYSRLSSQTTFAKPISQFDIQFDIGVLC